MKNLCYILACEGVAFKNFHALEQSHGIHLGSSYMWPDSAKTFTHFIAESQLLSESTANNLCFFLMDSVTDSRNLEVDIIFVFFWCKR